MYIRLFLISLFFLTCLPIYAQTDLPADSSGVVYTVVQQQASFVGGQETLLKFIKDNLRYPKVSACCEGKVYLRLMIDTKGNIVKTEIVRSMPDICKAWNEEAIRIVQNMPRWNPAVHKGKRVKCYFLLPINISFQN